MQLHSHLLKLSGEYNILNITYVTQMQNRYPMEYKNCDFKID